MAPPSSKKPRPSRCLGNLDASGSPSSYPAAGSPSREIAEPGSSCRRAPAVSFKFSVLAGKFRLLPWLVILLGAPRLYHSLPFFRPLSTTSTYSWAYAWVQQDAPPQKDARKNVQKPDTPQNHSAQTASFTDQAASRLLEQIKDGLEGHSTKKALAAFDLRS